MQADVYPITGCPAGRLAIMPRPRAGDWLADEVASWHRQGLEVVASLLEDEEIAELGLHDEPAACAAVGVRFLRLPIPDRGVPASVEAASAFVSILVAELRAGRGVGVHCRIGVGRSAVIAVCVLAALGVSVEAAWDMVEQSRRVSVPDTAEQREWPRVAWASGRTR